jgi:uncharacterized protein YkwD
MSKSLLVRHCLSCSIVVLIAAIVPLLPVTATPVTPPEPVEGWANFTSLQDPNQEFTGCGGQLVQVVNSQYESRVVELVNSERASRGLPPLKRVTLLDDASRYHAKDLADDNYFEHDTYDRSGSSLVKICAWSSRISSYYTGWSSLGENIAAGYSTPESVMSGWMNSDGHRANILRDTFWEIGVGYYAGGGNYYHYWVQDFGKRTGYYPIIINNDASTTTNRDVSLYIYGSWTEMRLRNNSDAWTAWLPFSNTYAWTLPAVTGNHTVSVELRKTGASASSSDTIFLDYPLQPVLGNIPDAITFTYSISSQMLMPASIQITPQNTGNGAVLTWQTSTVDNWYEITPQSGSTPTAITVIPDNFSTNTPGTYMGMFTVTVTSPTGVIGSPHQTAVSLSVVEDPIYTNYLPALLR